MFHSFEARTATFTSPDPMTICPSLSAAHPVKLCFHQCSDAPHTQLTWSLLTRRPSSAPSPAVCTFLVMSFPKPCVSFHRDHAREAELSPIFHNKLIRSAVKMTHKLALFLLKSKNHEFIRRECNQHARHPKEMLRDLDNPIMLLKSFPVMA